MILRAEHITRLYDGAPVIEDVTVTLNDGEIVSLIGRSGIGKTTLFNILSGLDTPDSGQVFLKGENITGISGHVGYMLQDDLLLPFKTVVNNTAMPLILQGMKQKEAVNKALQYFDNFGLSGTQNNYPAQLSGGMRQRAALLRSYLYSKDILLLDEPFSALDSLTKATMEKWFYDIAHSQGISAFLITHDIDEAILLSDRIYVMAGKPGKISEEIRVERVLKDPDEFALTNEFSKLKQTLKKIVA
jgi:ABC-type nitrate/sulfonate/bicarbonate transport system ATPase subunit